MPSIFSVAPQNLEEMRQQVLERFAALIRNQTRTRNFAENVSGLVHQFNAEICEGISSSMALLEKTDLSRKDKDAIIQTLRAEIDHAARLDSTLELLLGERQRQWHKNSEHLKQILFDFSHTVESLAGTLIEKDLLERQSHVLENIIISHEKVSQWRVFVQEILANFHSIFPFNFFFIAFAEEHGLALYLYFLGDYPDEVKALARKKLTTEMIGIPGNESDNLRQVGDKGGHEERIAETGFLLHPAKDVLDGKRGKGLAHLGDRQDLDMVLLRKVVKEFSQLVGVEIEGENATNLKDVEDARCPVSYARKPGQESAVHREMPISPIAEVDHKDVGVNKRQARARVHRMASCHVLKRGRVARSDPSISAQASSNGRTPKSLACSSATGERRACGLPFLVMRIFSPLAT